MEQGFDAGLRIGEMHHREMVGVRVSPDLRTAIVGSPGYFAARGKPKHPRELHDHDCISYPSEQRCLYRWEFSEQGKDFAVTVGGRHGR